MGAALGLAAASTLRFTTAGSVDDGKSTLIGRLLLDAKGLLEDQLAAALRTTRRRGDGGCGGGGGGGEPDHRAGRDPGR